MEDIENPIIKEWFDSDFRVRLDAMKRIVHTYGDENLIQLIKKIKEEAEK